MLLEQYRRRQPIGVPKRTAVATRPRIGGAVALPECLHGTHVAGIAAGKGNGAVSFSGVAPDAQLMAVQVFTKITNAVDLRERPRAWARSPRISSPVWSACIPGAGTQCRVGEHEPWRKRVQLSLRQPAVQTGHRQPSIDRRRNGHRRRQQFVDIGVSSPGCISSAVSVGSTDKANRVSWFSNIAPFVSLLAPGEAITSSIPGGGFQALSGTSMATPHVAGTWGLLREAVPTASVGTILNALKADRPGDCGYASRRDR